MYCPFCGKKTDDNGVCHECGYNPGTGFDDGGKKQVSSIPVWAKILLACGLFFISGATVIGIIIGLVLKTSKDPQYAEYGRIILKYSLIMLAVKVAITILAAVCFVGLNAVYFTFPRGELRTMLWTV